jgi:hypothetical protein
MNLNLADRYRSTMMRHRYGYALYEPEMTSRLHPGMLGFLDEYRRWHPLLKLDDPIAVKAAGFDPIEAQMLSETDVITRGPLTSNTVNDNEVVLAAGTDALSLGLPVGISGYMEYSTAMDFGAVLMCDDKVESYGYDLRMPFLSWLKRNSKALVQKWPDIKKYGVIATTRTYSASKVYIQAWTGADKKIVIGFDVEVPGVANAGPEVSWHRAHSSQGWSRWDDQKRVVFFTGAKIEYTLFGTRNKNEDKWRGGKIDEFQVRGFEDGTEATATVELFGDDWEEIERDKELEDEDGDD